MQYDSHKIGGQKPVKHRAFTLVELLAVVGIMLLMLKLTLPSLDGILGSDARGMARTQLIGDLNRARSMALARGAPVYVVFMPLYQDESIMAKETYRVVNGDEVFKTESLSKWANGYLEEKENKSSNDLLGGQLLSYALYVEDLPGVNVRSGKWLTDWKRLPQGYHINDSDLGSLNGRVWVTRLKNNEPTFLKYMKDKGMAPATLKRAELVLPCLKYNARGELEGAGLGGLYFSVSRGGVFAPEMVNGLYKAQKSEPPEQAAVEVESYWLHVNAITGRAVAEDLTEEEAEGGKSLNDRLTSDEYHLYIYNSPEWPADFYQKIGCPDDYAGPSPWQPSGGVFISKPNEVTGELNPAFTYTSREKAIRGKWNLEQIYPTIGIRLKAGLK